LLLLLHRLSMVVVVVEHCRYTLDACLRQTADADSPTSLRHAPPPPPPSVRTSVYKCVNAFVSTSPTAQHSTDDRNLVYGAVRSAEQQQQKKKKKKKKKGGYKKVSYTHAPAIPKEWEVGSGRICG